jgi:hypothetical protein
MFESDYWLVRGDTMQAAIERIADLDKDDLVKLIVNNRLNEFVSTYADYKDNEVTPHGVGKRVPYIGWYWRAVDFVGGNIPIGDCGQFVGVMANNKWDYNERMLTPDEAAQVTAIVWKAKELSEQGGELNEIIRGTKAELEKLWDLFQTFNVE